MQISIIIVNYNTAKFTIPCIQSIVRKRRMGLWPKSHASNDIEVIVVDNASSDGSVETIRNFKFPISNFQLIDNKSNLGYAKAVNQGINAARGDYIFILNPDTQLTKGAVDKLLEFAQTHEEAGVVGPRLLNPDGSIQASCYHEPSIWNAFKEYFLGIKGTFDKYVPSGSEPTQVDAVVGAAMFIPRKVIDKARMFNERYFMYFEDLDFCRKVRNAGFNVYYLPSAEIIHEHGGITRTVGEKARSWLIESSIVYHGIAKHNLLTFILWVGQKWQRILAS